MLWKTQRLTYCLLNSNTREIKSSGLHIFFNIKESDYLMGLYFPIKFNDKISFKKTQMFKGK